MNVIIQLEILKWFRKVSPYSDFEQSSSFCLHDSNCTLIYALNENYPNEITKSEYLLLKRSYFSTIKKGEFYIRRYFINPENNDDSSYVLSIIATKKNIEILSKETEIFINTKLIKNNINRNIFNNIKKDNRSIFKPDSTTKNAKSESKIKEEHFLIQEKMINKTLNSFVNQNKIALSNTQQVKKQAESQFNKKIISREKTNIKESFKYELPKLVKNLFLSSSTINSKYYLLGLKKSDETAFVKDELETINSIFPTKKKTTSKNLDKILIYLEDSKLDKNQVKELNQLNLLIYMLDYSNTNIIDLCKNEMIILLKLKNPIKKSINISSKNNNYFIYLKDNIFQVTTLLNYKTNPDLYNQYFYLLKPFFSNSKMYYFLKEYVDSSFDINLTSKKLNIHRNTVYKRINILNQCLNNQFINSNMNKYILKSLFVISENEM